MGRIVRFSVTITPGESCSRCERVAVIWSSNLGALCREHDRLWHKRRRQYRARAAKRARNWDSEAWAKKFYGYVPRFFGGPFDGQRADVHHTSKHGPSVSEYMEAGYYQKPGLHHYYHPSTIAGSLPAETSGVTLDTP